MPGRERDRARQRVLVCAPGTALAALAVLAPDLEIRTAAPASLARRALDLQPRVIVFDGEDTELGVRIVHTLRNAGSDARIVLLTPPEAERARLEALEAGADEALARPVTTSELVGRIRLLLHRGGGPRRTRLPIGERLDLDLDRRQLLRDGEWVHLRPKEARLLELFARSPGKVLTRAHILARVWGPDHEGDPRTVDVHVRWLRAKIEPDPHDPVWLLTVRGVGYRLESVR